MDPVAEPLRMYGSTSDAPALPWSWVDEQLAAAGTYWVVATGDEPPHPRPVWGVWTGDRLHLSIGSIVVARRLRASPRLTAHLDSGVDVVIVEGVVTGSTTDPDLVRRYEEKYDWRYDVGEYGPLTTVAPSTVLAWQSAGWAGRGGFRRTGRWRFAGASDAST